MLTVPLLASIVACALPGEDSAPSTADVSVQHLTVRVAADLPVCTPAFEGIVAYVSSTASFVVCATQQWTPIQLPEGPAGPSGPAGAAGATSRILLTPIPAGSICRFGGTQIQVGVDTNGDGALQPEEVQQTAVVCNGATESSTSTSTGGNAPPVSTDQWCGALWCPPVAADHGWEL